MKYLIILLAFVTLPVHAATFKSVSEEKPIFGSDFVSEWKYEFYFTSPAGSKPAVVIFMKETCKRPHTPDGRLLYPLFGDCYEREDLARPVAQKEADEYEKKERSMGVITAKIVAMNKPKK